VTIPQPVLSESTSKTFQRKRVLLVDASDSKREVRAEAMRELGVDVDCAADIPEARSWWRPGFYDLVLVSVEAEKDHRDKFCLDVRTARPPQKLAFLVGQPEYLADSPKASEESPAPKADDEILNEVKVGFAIDHRDSIKRGGLMEASRRISEVRTAFLGRTRAIRALPAPPRDSEGRPLKRGARPAVLDDLLREELE
jgi:hypothetical protein